MIYNLLNRLALSIFIIVFFTISLQVFINIEILKVKILYLILTISFNLYLVYSIINFKSLFNLFISIYLWLGFYFQLSIKYLLKKNNNYADIDYFFRISDTNKSEVLLLSILICVSFLIITYFSKFNYKFYKTNNLKNLNNFFFSLDFYKKNKLKIFCILYFFFLITLSSNFYFEIYQRGIVSEFKNINYLYSFLIQLFFPSLFYIILNYELILNPKKTLIIVCFIFFIIFPIDLSIISRSVPLLIFCIVLIFINFHLIPISLQRGCKILFLFIFISIISYSNFFLVDYFRNIKYYNETNNISYIHNYKSDGNNFELKKIIYNKKGLSSFLDLFVNRFIGIDKLSSLLIHNNKENKLKEAINYEFNGNEDKANYYDWYLYSNNVGHSYYVDNLSNEKLKGNNVLGFLGYLYLSKSPIVVLSLSSLFLLLLLCFEKYFYSRYQNFWLSFLVIYFLTVKFINLSSIKSLIINGISIIILLIIFEVIKYFYNRFFYSRS